MEDDRKAPASHFCEISEFNRSGRHISRMPEQRLTRQRPGRIEFLKSGIMEKHFSPQLNPFDARTRRIEFPLVAQGFDRFNLVRNVFANLSVTPSGCRNQLTSLHHHIHGDPIKFRLKRKAHHALGGNPRYPVKKVRNLCFRVSLVQTEHGLRMPDLIRPTREIIPHPIDLSRYTGRRFQPTQLKLQKIIFVVRDFRSILLKIERIVTRNLGAKRFNSVKRLRR